jgi:hypothetical protein
MRQVTEAILHLGRIRKGSPEVDQYVFTALGWHYHPGVRRGLRQYRGRWRKGNNTRYDLPRVSTSTKDAEQLVNKQFSYTYNPTTHMYMVDEADFNETPYMFQAHTYPLLCCMVGLHNSEVNIGQQEL